MLLCLAGVRYHSQGLLAGYSCLCLCEATSECYVFDFSFPCFRVSYFSDFFRAVRLSAVTFCFCQLRSFHPGSGLLLGLRRRFSSHAPGPVISLCQLRVFHSLSQSLAPVASGVLWRVVFVVEMASFCLPVRVSCCSGGLRDGTRLSMIQQVPFL